MGQIEKRKRDNHGISRDQILTVDDLYTFRSTLIQDIKEVVTDVLSNNRDQHVKKWLKSEEVRDLLKLSTGKLYSLRKKGLLPFTRIGGMIYYSYADIQNLLERGKLMEL